MKVFISYRRKDIHYIADRIYERLEHAGLGEIMYSGMSMRFRSVGIFAASCRTRVMSSGAMPSWPSSAPAWLGETDAAGRRRVDDPGDWVRVEIETALHA